MKVICQGVELNIGLSTKAPKILTFQVSILRKLLFLFQSNNMTFNKLPYRITYNKNIHFCLYQRVNKIFYCN